jgi:RHS repeat-associated protein
VYDSGVRSRSTGKERDAETGLDYFGARYFSAAQGRFTSPDWSAVPEPVPYADFENPQTLNLYAYVQNNPLSRRDQFGHEDDPCKGNVNTCVTVRPDSPPPSIVGAIAVGHHFVDQALVKAKDATETFAGKFFDLWRTGRLDVRGWHISFTLPHRLNSAQIKALINQLEQETGKPMAEWGEAEVTTAVERIRAAGGDIKTFLDHIEANNPLARTVRADITALIDQAKAAFAAIEQNPVVGPVVEGVENACETEPMCGLPPIP